MAEEFGQYNFNFIHYVIQKAEITDNTLTIEGMNGYTVGRIITDSLSHAMYYKMLGTVRSKEIPFHFLHVQNTNQVIENIYSVVKAEVE